MVFEYPLNAYQLSQGEKQSLFLHELGMLTEYHLQKCWAYARLFEKLQLKKPPYLNIEEIPYLPVSLFKTHDLRSIPSEQIFKTMLSSGTTHTGQSRIFLDRETAQKQMEVLAKIMKDTLGAKRLPMLIVDTKQVLRDRLLFSARGAAIAGMQLFGLDPFYLLDHSSEELEEWKVRHGKRPWFVFGMTSTLWQTPLPRCTSGSILIHGGGWKKLEGEGITREEFKRQIFERSGIHRCYNFYGMVEQTGSIALECDYGLLHVSDFSEIIIRTSKLEPAKQGDIGVIQVLSRLPKSYPGHSLLTDDLGMECSIDSCSCGRKGKAFQVMGRIPQTAPRGCSDVPL